MALIYKLSGNNLSQTMPSISEDGKNYIFLQSVVTNISGAPIGKFEQVDNTAFEVPITGFDPLKMAEYAEAAALVYIEETYQNPK